MHYVWWCLQKIWYAKHILDFFLYKKLLLASIIVMLDFGNLSFMNVFGKQTDYILIEDNKLRLDAVKSVFPWGKESVNKKLSYNI